MHKKYGSYIYHYLKFFVCKNLRVYVKTLYGLIFVQLAYFVYKQTIFHMSIFRTNVPARISQITVAM